jgi:hypothetical protein
MRLAGSDESSIEPNSVSDIGEAVRQRSDVVIDQTADGFGHCIGAGGLRPVRPTIVETLALPGRCLSLSIRGTLFPS